jgi:hypothetical protein
VTAWIRRHPAAAFLPLQAILCFWNLGMLSPWMDEVTSLQTVRLPLPDLIRSAASDIHPPGYYLLLWVWQQLPLGLDWAVQARALSIIVLLAAGAAADHFLGSRLPERTRLGFLALWTFSPCLLLYGRMCRSYSLQILVIVLAAACLERFCDTPGRRTGALLAVAISGSLYVHYVPGLAMLATANLVLFRRRRIRHAIVVSTLALLVYLPWIWTLARSLRSWTTHPEVYAVTGGSWFEIPVKLAYWAMSFVAGEAQPDWALGGVGLLACLVLFLCSRTRSKLIPIAIPLTLISFIGVARWVSYPFIPARMLFVFPFFLLLAATGAAAHRRTGALAMAAMLLLSLTGIWCYFHKTGFRNKQYPMPMTEIAAQISQQSTAADSVVLVDSTNSDPAALAYALGPAHPVLPTAAGATELELDRALADPRIRTVWFLRNTHDVSPGHLDQRFELLLLRRMRPAIHPFEPFTPLETWMMRRVGMPDPPSYFQELLEFRR